MLLKQLKDNNYNSAGREDCGFGDFYPLEDPHARQSDFSAPSEHSSAAGYAASARRSYSAVQPDPYFQPYDRFGSMAMSDSAVHRPDSPVPLVASYQPSHMDVICARGKQALLHEGNQRFRSLIGANLERYSLATTKLEKSIIVKTVVDAVRRASPNGGFIKQEGGRWYEVGSHAAREKVGQSFRDLLHTKYKSSSKAKKRRKKEAEEQLANDIACLMNMQESISEKMEEISRQSGSDEKSLDGSLSTLFNETNAELLGQIKQQTQGRSQEDETDLPIPYGFVDVEGAEGEIAGVGLHESRVEGRDIHSLANLGVLPGSEDDDRKPSPTEDYKDIWSV